MTVLVGKRKKNLNEFVSTYVFMNKLCYTSPIGIRFVVAKHIFKTNVHSFQ